MQKYRWQPGLVTGSWSLRRVSLDPVAYSRCIRRSKNNNLKLFLLFIKLSLFPAIPGFLRVFIVFITTRCWMLSNTLSMWSCDFNSLVCWCDGLYWLIFKYWISLAFYSKPHLIILNIFMYNNSICYISILCIYLQVGYIILCICLHVAPFSSCP